MSEIKILSAMKYLKLSLVLLLSMISFVGFAQLPSVQLKSIDGKVVDTATLSNDGKPFVISFFATWCKPCNRELKAIHEVYPDWQDETGMRLIAISIDEAQNAQKVKPLVDSEGWEYEVLLDPNSDFFHALGGQMIPFVVTVDGSGKIVESHSGYIDGAESHIIELIKSLQE
jgi:peroxiredoxin